ncbi:uncharacterized protein LOC143294613 [Babylonia areolata]|uniref:uncharacterized protein LOC143294613 n=1 Tax=Babylonia areolata TaxID=304850 RepID=UPI003FD53031
MPATASVSVRDTRSPCADSTKTATDARLSRKSGSPFEFGGTSFTSGLTATEATTVSQTECGTESVKSQRSRRRSDVSPNFPSGGGEKPNELLQRLYSLWPSQLTGSYRPHATGNPEATAEMNLRYVRELYPLRRKGMMHRKGKAVGMVVGAIDHMNKQSRSGLNLAAWPRH